MGRKSSIHRLEPEIKSHIERRLRENQMTLDELLDDLQKAFPDQSKPSRSALGRYRKAFDNIASRMRQQSEMAQLLVSELGENPDERAGALMVQAITTMTTHAAFNAQEDDDVDVDTVRHLARAAKDVLQARKLSLEERKAIEKAAREKLLAEQEENLVAVAQAQGMSADTVKFWREQVLGVKTQ